MALAPGTRLGHYDVTSLLGEGGMGQVWQATDTQLNRQVALKILPDAFAADPDRLARFEREAKVLASLNHPNIGSIYGLEEAEGMPHKPGMLHRITARLAQGEIDIHHLYTSAATEQEQSVVVLRTSHNDLAMVLLNEATTTS